MTLSSTLPQAAVDLVVAVLVRLLLPGLAGDTDAAKALALAMLAEYQPHTIRELGIAGEVIGLGLGSLNALAESAQPGLPAERIITCRRWACSLSRTGYQAQRRLDALQRGRQRGADGETVALQTARPIAVSESTPRENATAQTVPVQTVAPQTAASQTAAAQPAPMQIAPAQTAPVRTASAQTVPAQTVPAQTVPAQTVPTPTASAQTTRLPAQPTAPQPEPSLTQAECTYVDALTHLNLLKARYKGAPPPHSQAAQQIQAQQRIVDAARMKLELLRTSPQAAAPQPAPVRAAA